MRAHARISKIGALLDASRLCTLLLVVHALEWTCRFDVAPRSQWHVMDTIRLFAEMTGGFGIIRMPRPGCAARTDFTNVLRALERHYMMRRTGHHRQQHRVVHYLLLNLSSVSN